MDQQAIGRKERAILVGINYGGTDAELNGCVSDAVNMLDLAVRLGINDLVLAVDIDIVNLEVLEAKTVESSRDTLLENLNNVRLTSPTKEHILTEIREAVSDSEIGSIFFTYSGHGASGRESASNTEELDGRDEYICSLGNSGVYEGMYSSFISDDELFSTINEAAENRTTPIVITYVFDCCHSGTVFDLPHTLRKINENVTFSTEPTNNKKVLNSNVVMNGWSGCQDAQSSYENYNRINRMVEGICTRGFTKAVKDLILSNEIDAEINNFDLHNYIADHMFDIDSFNDEEVDISDAYQVVNHSSSENIGLTSNTNEIHTQKFVLGRIDRFSTVGPEGTATYVSRDNYSHLNIQDSHPEHKEEVHVETEVEIVEVEVEPPVSEEPEEETESEIEVPEEPEPEEPEPEEPEPEEVDSEDEESENMHNNNDSSDKTRCCIIL